MFKLFKTRLINGHTKAELKRHYAGKFIKKPEGLPTGTEVSIFQKNPQSTTKNGGGWWEQGDICCCGCTGRKAVNVGDSIYALDSVEVYLTKYYF